MTVGAVAGLELRRLGVRPLAWALAALTIAWLAWTFVLGLGQFLGAQVKLAAVADAPGFTDLVAIPLLAELAKLAFLVVPLMTMGLLAGERRTGTLALLSSTGLAPWRIVVGKYLAVLVWLALWLLATLAMPLLVVTIVILVREIGITVFRFVIIRTRVVPASGGGKLKTVFQSVAISLYLVPTWLLLGDWMHWVNAAVMAVALVLTLTTGIQYLVNAATRSKPISDATATDSE